jgi:hypothetical protein
MRAQLGDVALLSRAESFRRRSEECHLKADQAISSLDSQLWLLMAEQWSQLARYVADRPDDY